MNIPSKYDSKEVEGKWYDYWMKHNYFHSEVDDREPYTIVIPPPNVTGVLHMGHMLNNTIQDVLIRRARLQGKNACWVPGTDHASIATEAKVVAKLKEQGIDKNDLTREEFLAHAWEWKNEYGGIILEQLKKIGASCDWERTSFTMDPEMSESVIKVFVDLYNKGLIYRGYRMVNWDPEAKTTLSDEEVIHVEKQGNLYYLEYKIEGSDEKLTIATTRPETIFGDAAICINPNDEGFTHLKGKKAIVPLCNRVIPIIEDEYVDVEFGTGCLKVTPAHDQNDKVLGEKHKLEVIDIFNEDASLNSFGLHYQGKDRFVARKLVAKELEENGVLVKTEVHMNKVGTSERTKAVIEPRLSDQWFLKMEDLAKPAIEAVLGEDSEVKLYPKKFENTYRHWMENIRDWNISRQLWWGQQIPAYFYGDGKEDFVVANSIEEAVVLAKERTGKTDLVATDLKQDEDALDTWFSSWLWPMSVFDGINNPENEEIKYYYPTNDLVTGPDILFFWVARMIVAGYEYKDEKPFENVYLTGLVRDKQRRKMSKSLGNSPDALKLIEDYSADGVRVGLLLSSAAGNDLMFDEDLCKQGKGFSNKIWNAFRLVTGWEIDATIEQPESAKIGLEWYNAKFQTVLAEIEDHFSKYRLSDALMAIYKLIMDDFSSWLLEAVKPAYQQPIDKKTFDAVIAIFEDNLKVLHPFMPFLSEEIWQHITDRTPEEALIIAKYPELKKVDTAIISEFEFATDVVSGIRTIRKNKNISFKDAVELSVVNNENFTNKFDVLIEKLTNASTIKYVSEKVDGASFRVKSNEYFIPVAEEEIDVEAETIKLNGELKRAEGFLFGIQKKLSNERFVSNAPDQVIVIERKKESDTLAKIETIKSSLASLK
ncbi:valine--tRNA ligase [Tenacibaculum finnmarkense genomovar finnmarkense]|uniref:valine--tRNA ligase n=1 Tax=Tenacibaculum finnmarkense TaxID=2781243 RepID=UPI001E345EA0|nr:valine--tRNA ligase [Tenacibaculum finnmarkense]MCD8416874.1 valine--tRNA ligase [Tenacibaculum finnmarkense genomovar finnmarkense]MCG8185487.1 valine--tRNA ligase [Tenacibaculum finnmarkense genomovar finnmarkense]MCG8201871.1 valine--tRNA ligase [Tenacibaculum finnmarkense genomovar finnmarkense]MCG8209380.1 valine--tRNA ligase [Tenacibaculum finnmarkense genomovar finnmarkense]MCG8212176.1 valine--tRNA ligase [Tenacibaculum finnmarkense genomovar finnmarkense]